jgi:type 2 lantibiotic biosynthesis protein LanM
MHLDRKQMTLATGQNRPRLDDAEVNLLDYTPAILSGFTATYRLLMAQRDELLAPAGPLACFTGDEVRVVVRNTRTYMRLLQESFHPDMLRNALERERLFDHLWVGSEQLPVLARVIPSEREDLSNGDVPMFTARPGSRHLWNSAQACQADFLDEPSLVLAQRRLQQLDENDLTRQLWFIRASLATLARELEQTQPAPIRVPEPETPADRAQLLAAARAAGNRLAELAWEDQDEVSWVGLALTEGNWALSPLEEDLYDGLLGVTLFLAYLGTVSGEERYTALAKAALANARRQLQEIRPSLKAVGFSGWGGVIYTLAHLGVLWGQPALLAEAQEIVELLPPLIEQDEALDIMAGSAGCIGGLISLYQAAPSEQALAAIIRCAERLLARAQKLETGLGWHTHVAVLQPLTGFSHGAAGMAWALLEASALTGVERFRSTALDAMAYERSLFSAQAGNWPDLRDFEAYGAGKNTERFMLAWCHGAPGIGLARVCALRLVPEAKLRAELLAEINASLAITLAYGFGSNHSLCHGDLGNLELLLQAGEALDDADVRSRTYRLAAMILESVNQNGWLCGVPLSVETPGLMVGLAGIGYELLRLAEPGRVPSVLTLAPPYSTTGLSTTRGRPGARGRSAC